MNLFKKNIEKYIDGVGYLSLKKEQVQLSTFRNTITRQWKYEQFQ